MACTTSPQKVTFFDTTDTEDKAYVLGWIFCRGEQDEKTLRIVAESTSLDILKRIHDVLCDDNDPIIMYKNGTLALNLHCQQRIAAYKKLLEACDGQPALLLQDARLRWCFVRGCFDSSARIAQPSFEEYSQPIIEFVCSNEKVLNSIAEISQIKCAREGTDRLVFAGANALDLMRSFYDGFSSLHCEQLRSTYVDWCNYVPGLQGTDCKGDLVRCRWVKTCEAAVAPMKLRASDIGYDLTLISKKNQIGNLYYYDTGIKLQPEFGWYAEIVPRSSLPKSGHMLANSMGIIDRAYTGNIIVALFKVDPDAKEIELPFRAVQIILRPTVHFEMQQVQSIDETERGAKGFGSSGRN